MNKAELIAAITDHADMTKADAGRALDAFIDIVTDSLKWREEISLVGFGTFSVKDRAARTGRNPPKAGHPWRQTSFEQANRSAPPRMSACSPRKGGTASRNEMVTPDCGCPDRFAGTAGGDVVGTGSVGKHHW